MEAEPGDISPDRETEGLDTTSDDGAECARVGLGTSRGRSRRDAGPGAIAGAAVGEALRASTALAPTCMLRGG
jgi:hypothetical protein